MRTESFRIQAIHPDKGLLTVVADWAAHAHQGNTMHSWLFGQQGNCLLCHVTNSMNLQPTNKLTNFKRLSLDMYGTLPNHLYHINALAFSPDGNQLAIGRVLELQVRPTTRIVIDGKDRKLGDLKTGILVEIDYRPGEKPQAVRITAQGKSSEGVVGEVDLETRTLTLHQEDEGKDEIVETDIVVVKDARILINGKPAQLQNLKPNMRVSVQHSAVKPVLVAVTAAGPRVEGVLTAVDPKKLTLTLNLKNIHVSTSPVNIAPDAKIQVNGRDATVADLKPGMRVTLRMAAESDRSVAVGISTLRVVRK